MYKNRGEVRMFLEILLSLATTSTFVFFAIKPTVLTIIELNNSIREKRDTITKLDKKLSQLKLAYKNYSLSVDKIRLLESAVPDNPSPDNVAFQLDNLAQRNSTNLTKLTVQETTIAGKSTITDDAEAVFKSANQLGFGINLTAAYSNLWMMIRDLEATLRPIFISALTLTAGTEDETMGLSINGFVPYYKI